MTFTGQTWKKQKKKNARIHLLTKFQKTASACSKKALRRQKTFVGEIMLHTELKPFRVKYQHNRNKSCYFKLKKWINPSSVVALSLTATSYLLQHILMILSLFSSYLNTNSSCICLTVCSFSRFLRMATRAEESLAFLYHCISNFPSFFFMSSFNGIFITINQIWVRENYLAWI